MKEFKNGNVTFNHRRINFRWTNEAGEADCETQHIVVVDGEYDFADWLRANGCYFEEDGDDYYITDGMNGERTGGYYTVISEEETDEELLW